MRATSARTRCARARGVGNPSCTHVCPAHTPSTPAPTPTHIHTFPPHTPPLHSLKLLLTRAHEQHPPRVQALVLSQVGGSLLQHGLTVISSDHAPAHARAWGEGREVRGQLRWWGRRGAAWRERRLWRGGGPSPGAHTATHTQAQGAHQGACSTQERGNAHLKRPLAKKRRVKRPEPHDMSTSTGCGAAPPPPPAATGAR